jgi:hypothetical protein
LGHFVPAPVQREFQWRTEQTRQLLEDVFGAFQRTGDDPGDAPNAGDTGEEEETAEEEEAGPPDLDPAKISGTRSTRRKKSVPREYFLGGVILFKAPQAEGSYQIYDGLQRLTTINLLLAKLRDSWPGGPSAQAHTTLSSMLFGEQTEPRVRVPTSGRTLADVLNARSLHNRELTEGDYRMREAVKFFAQELATWSNERRAAFLRFFADNVRLTVTEVDNPSLAYQMFVAANARGLSLAIGDILKGQLVEQVSQVGGTVGQIQSTALKWRSAQLRLRRGFDDFLHALEVLRFRPGPNDRHAPGELLVEMFEDEASAQSIESWVANEFSQLADIFERSRNHLAQQQARGADLHFRQLSFLGWKEWQPFYLALGLANHRSTPAVWEKQISSLHRAGYIIELLDWSARKRRKTFLAAIEQLEKKSNPFSARGGELGFGPKLRGIAARNLRGPLASGEKRGAIVRWVETLHWGPNLPKSCTDDASVEHILPITAMGDWEKKFSDDERERLTHRLGNLCIIPKDVNDKVGHSQWPEKEREYEPLVGHFKGVELVLDAARAGVPAGQATAWSAGAIEALTEQLASKAERALQLGPRR